MVARACLVFATLLGAYLRFRDLGARSVWYNEADSICFLEYSFGEILQRCREPWAVHPPLYFIVLKTWSLLFGYSDGVLRVPAAICATVIIPGVYLVVRDTVGLARASSAAVGANRPALLAAAMVSISPLQIDLARQVRGYSMAAMFLTLGSWSFVRAVMGDRRCARYWIAALLMGLAACFTHHLAVLSVVTQGVIAVVSCRARRLPLTFRRTVGIAAFVAAGLVLVVSSNMSRQSRTIFSDEGDPITWRGAANNVALALSSTAYSSRDMTPFFGVVIASALLLALAFLVVRGGWSGRYLAGSGLAPTLGLAFFSLVSSRTLVAPRYLAFSQVYWLCSLAFIVCGVRPRVERMALVGWVLALSVYGCWWAWPTIGRATQPGMRAAVSVVAGNRRPGEAVVARTIDALCCLRHYGRGSIAPSLLVTEAVRERQRGAEHLREEHLMTIGSLVASRPDGVWIISTPRQGMPDFDPRAHWILERIWSFNQEDDINEGPVTVEHYELARGLAPRAPERGRERNRRAPEPGGPAFPPAVRAATVGPFPAGRTS